MMRLENRPVCITGGASGMGAALARLCSADGAPVAILDLPTSSGMALVEEIGAERALFINCDVAEEDQVRAAFGQIEAHFGGLYGLANFAGTNHRARIIDMQLADWNRVLAVNVRGMFLTMKYAFPLMRRFGSGAVVNMASVSGMIGSDGYAAYHTSKGAVMALTRSVSQEGARDGIRVNAVAPGWVDTPFTDAALAQIPDGEAVRAAAGSYHALGRMGQPDEIAAAALWLLTDEASFVTAETLFVDGGFMIKR